MEDIRPNSVACFDNRYTNNHISKIKVLLHFLAPSMQNKLAVYIKFMELQYTLQFSRNAPLYRSSLSDSVMYGESCRNQDCRKETCPESSCNTFSANIFEKMPDFDRLCEELFPYCEPHEKQQFTQLRNTFQTLQNLQNMMEMMETLKDLFPEGMGSGDGQGGFNPEILAAMSSMFSGGDMDLGAMAEMLM